MCIATGTRSNRASTRNLERFREQLLQQHNCQIGDATLLLKGATCRLQYVALQFILCMQTVKVGTLEIKVPELSQFLYII